MKKKFLVFTMLVFLAATLAVFLSGCGAGDGTEGKNIVTFEMNGGVLNYGTSSTKTSINYAYYPGTLIKDPTAFPNYTLTRNGYVFTGWYTSADCKPGEEWNFDNYFEQETLILYAGWEKAIKFTFSVNYKDENGKIVTLGSYPVKAGDKFDDYLRYSNKRDGYTAMKGFYLDADCTIAWDDANVHPGGDADYDYPVYVKYIKGDWILVETYEELNSALKSGNVYLLNDIDCEGGELNIPDKFNKVFEGNDHKIANFTVNKKGNTFTPTCSIFRELGEKADIRNISFENVTYNFFEILDQDSVKIKVAALATAMENGAKISNVSVSGTFNTDYENDYARLNDVFYYKDGEDTSALEGVKNFTANITVNKQSQT